MNQRLATKLATYTILLGILMGSIVSATQIRDLYLKSTAEINARAIQLIELTLDAAAEAVYQLDAKIANDLLNGLMNYELILESAIYDELNQELAKVSRPRSKFKGLGQVFEIEPVKLEYKLPVRNGTKVAGTFTATLDVQAGLKPFYELAVSAALAQILQAIGLSLLVFLIVVYLITNPVSNLARTLAEIKPGSVDRLPLDSAHENDEIGHLIQSANSYLEAVTVSQNQLSKNQEDLQDILDNLNEAVITVDKNGSITSANKAAHTMFFHEGNSLVNEHFCGLMTNFEFKDIEGFISHINTSNNAVPHSHFGIGKAKQTFPIDISVSLASKTHSLWTIKDISEKTQSEKDRVALEEQLRQSQKMEAIGTLAGGIAHDFNNMLSGLVGFAQLAQEESKPNSELRDNINHVISIANQATQLVRQILTFSRKKDEKKEILDLVAVVENCRSLIRQTTPASIELAQMYSDDTFTIFADETMMQQVVMNLYSNAAAAIGNNNGKISVSLDRIDAKPPTYGSEDATHISLASYIRIRVEDTGCGIHEETLHRIFEPYYTTKEVDAGTGMGLAVVHSIIKNHQGWIEVDSSAAGTTFYIYLPHIVATHAEKSVPEPINLASGDGNEHILIVDDSEDITKMLSRMLKKRGYRVTISGNGNDAIALFSQSPETYDLVVTDQTMPGKNGDVLASEMLAMRPDIPIILCTGYSDYFTKESAIALGIRRFMPKPVSNADLCSAIRSVLDEPNLA